jgi:putative transposase
LRARMRELALRHPRYGHRRVWALLRAEGFGVNVKRVRRLWIDEGLKVPKRPAKRGGRKACGGSGVNACHRRRPEWKDHVWTFDFCHDRTADGGALKIFSVVDEFTRRCLAVEARRRLNGADVASVLTTLVAEHGEPGHVRCDNGPEFVCRAVRRWLDEGATVSGLYVTPASPWENGYAEAYHARLRDEVLDRQEFGTVAEARALLTAWRREYNEERPHSALGYKTPSAFAASCPRARPDAATPRPGGHGDRKDQGGRCCATPGT